MGGVPVKGARLVLGMALGAALLASAPVTAGGIVYVDDDAVPAGDGTSWETAFRFLRDGLDAAAKGGVSEVRVGEGVQVPDRNETTPGGTQDRQDTFLLANGVVVRGGYAGIGAPDPNARDVAKFRTILSGDLLGNDGPGFANYDDNSFHVVLATDTDTTAVLDGFTVRAGNGVGLRIQSAARVLECTFDANLGGGVDQNDSAGGSILTACTFTGNAALRGGGLEAEAPMTLSDCAFEDNAASRAGAVYAAAAIRLTRCTFIGNEATSLTAGAVELGGEGSIVEECVFESNRSVKAAGAVEARYGTFRDCAFVRNTSDLNGGGAMLVSGPVSLARCTFEANTATDEGGAILVMADEVLILDCMFTMNGARRGGAIRARMSGSMVITGCTFLANEAPTGGGLSLEESSPVVSKCDFNGNVANDAAGIAVDMLSEPAIIDCVFLANNAARNGAGIACTGSRPVIRDCRFEANEAQQGAGIYSQSESEPLVTRSTFEANRAIRGAGIANDDDSRPVILECTFLGNVATGSGGGIANTDSDVIIGRCRFLGNRATALGGGLHNVVNSVVTVTNSVFSGNTATEGGAVRSFDSVGSLVNCTLVGNGAVFGAALSSLGGSDTSVENCVLWSNGPDAIDAESITVRYCDVEGGHPGVGNIDADPLLADPPGPDGVAGTSDDDLRLLAGSPAIDAGDSDALPGDINLDVAGGPRFVDDPATPDTGTGAPPFIDLGAYEFQVACVGDVDGDGSVGFSDVLAILATWGPCPSGPGGPGGPGGPAHASECPEDIDGDGVVGFADVLFVLGAWGACP